MTTPTRITNKGREADPVLVVGSVAYDSIVTPHDKGERILGGSASYACLAASYFAPPRIVGVVGHDFRDRDRNKLAKRGAVSWLRTSSCKSGRILPSITNGEARCASGSFGLKCSKTWSWRSSVSRRL